MRREKSTCAAVGANSRQPERTQSPAQHDSMVTRACLYERPTLDDILTAASQRKPCEPGRHDAIGWSTRQHSGSAIRYHREPTIAKYCEGPSYWACPYSWVSALSLELLAELGDIIERKRRVIECDQGEKRLPIHYIDDSRPTDGDTHRTC